MSLLPFETSSTTCVAGCTGSGKTYWVKKLLEGGMYADPPKEVLYCYAIWQPLYDTMNVRFHKGLPTAEEVESFADGEHKLIVLDDLMDRVCRDPEMELLFTQGCHHRRLSIVFITQNLFRQGKHARTISLNTWYLVLFRNYRDASQIDTLGRQMFPGKVEWFREVYRDATKPKYGYLIVDACPHSEDKYRIRTRIFPGEFPIVYK